MVGLERSALSRLWFVLALVLLASACQDRRPEPLFVSASASGKNASPKATSDKRYFIEFRARYALSYGHSYVVYGRLNEQGGMIHPQVAGLHPKSKSEARYVAGHFVPVPAETGWSDGDLEEEYRSASWRVMLSEAEFKKVSADIRRLQASSPVWHAALYNCNAFVADIARSLGYRTPPIWLRPQEFITQLRKMQTGT